MNDDEESAASLKDAWYLFVVLVMIFAAWSLEQFFGGLV